MLKLAVVKGDISRCCVTARDVAQKPGREIVDGVATHQTEYQSDCAELEI